jgi:hypothetical protein
MILQLTFVVYQNYQNLFRTQPSCTYYLYYAHLDLQADTNSLSIADIKNKTLRIIGVPEARYREDPVRMLRVVRFAAKLNFKIAAELTIFYLKKPFRVDSAWQGFLL